MFLEKAQTLFRFCFAVVGSSCSFWLFQCYTLIEFWDVRITIMVDHFQIAQADLKWAKHDLISRTHWFWICIFDLTCIPDTN